MFDNIVTSPQGYNYMLPDGKPEPTSAAKGVLPSDYAWWIRIAHNKIPSAGD